MRYFVFLFVYILALTVVRSSPIEEEIQIHSKAFKNKLWPTNRTLTWKLGYGPLPDDSKEIYRDIQQSFDDSSLDLSNSDDDDSIVSSSYQSVQPNAILSKQDQHGIQTLYGTNQDLMRSPRATRFVRSLKRKHKKSAKKGKIIKKKPTKKRKPIKKKKPAKRRRTKKKTTKKPIQRGGIARIPDNAVIVGTFKTSDLESIKKTIQSFKPENKFKDFSAISDIIKQATGMVPDVAIPILQQLSRAYSKISMMFKISFADTGAILSKFVIKSYRVMERGMNKNDLAILQEFKHQLTDDMVKQFESFVNASREQLNEIHQLIVGKAKGSRGLDLLKNKNDLENDLLRRSKLIKEELSESGRIQGKIDSLLYEQRIVKKGLEDSHEGKEQAKKERDQLKAQIPDYEAKIQSHRDTHSEERGRFWFFTWKVRDIHINNGESIARENLNRLLERIQNLQRMIDNWSNVDLQNRESEIVAQLPKYAKEKNATDHMTKQFKGYYDEVEGKFNATVKEIDDIYASLGTVSMNSIDMIGKIAGAIQSGEMSFQTAYGSVRDYLKTIDVDKDLLVNSVIAALRFMHMTDEYMGTSKIQTIRDILGIE